MLKNRLMGFILGMVFMVLPGTLWAEEFQLPPIKQSQAYQQYALRDSKTELSKLLYLMDRYRQTPYIIHYEGHDYDAQAALMQARKYVAKNYQKEPAEEFIRVHAYRPKIGSSILYVKYPDGQTVLLRDILLAELQALESLEK